MYILRLLSADVWGQAPGSTDAQVVTCGKFGMARTTNKSAKIADSLI